MVSVDNLVASAEELNERAKEYRLEFKFDGQLHPPRQVDVQDWLKEGSKYPRTMHLGYYDTKKIDQPLVFGLMKPLKNDFSPFNIVTLIHLGAERHQIRDGVWRGVILYGLKLHDAKTSSRIVMPEEFSYVIQPKHLDLFDELNQTRMQFEEETIPVQVYVPGVLFNKKNPSRRSIRKQIIPQEPISKKLRS